MTEAPSSPPADILIIDDIPANLRLLTQMLSEAGYRVRPYTRGEAAITSALATPPDIILLDVMMPELDGFAICDRLKAHPHTRDIPVIFLSAIHDTENKLRAFETGGVDYITKPFQVSEVLARIRTHLKICELQQMYQQQNALLQQEIGERRRAEQSLIHQTEELSTLYRLSLSITSGLEFSHILDTLHHQLSTLMPIDVFYVAQYNAATDMIHMPAYFERDQNGELVPDRNVPSFTARPSGFAEYILRTGQMLYIPDTIDPTVELPAQPIHLGGAFSRSYLGIPLVWQQQISGLLSVQSYRAKAYSDEQIRLVQAVAVQTAIAMENARLYEEAQAARQTVEATNHELQKALIELEHLATTDKLTGAFNRRKFDEIIHGEIKRALRFHASLSLVIIDIDHFKIINDTYGHIAGDQVLTQLVRLVAGNIRSFDTLTRWGGEEFLVLSPGNTLEQAVEMAERLRRIVELADFPEVGKITISLGVSTYQPGDTVDQLIRRADRALYFAKHNGRNCVGRIADND